MTTTHTRQLAWSFYKKDEEWNLYKSVSGSLKRDREYFQNELLRELNDGDYVQLNSVKRLVRNGNAIKIKTIQQCAHVDCRNDAITTNDVDQPNCFDHP